MFSVPELSQDFYRFIWDGMLNTKGLNPYLHLPNNLIETELIQKETLSPVLFEKMGTLNASNFSTYPPIAQLIYTISYAIGGSNMLFSIILLRLFNILAEAGIVWFGLKILSHLKLPKTNILLFVLNPLVILESSFSLHFEVVMIFFLTLSFYCLFTSRINFSALGMAGAIASKLLPLMFLPLFLGYFNQGKAYFNRNQLRRYVKFLTVLGLGIIAFYLYFFNLELFNKSAQTLGLYFTSFEFNASIYYVLRQVGFWISGYNQIEFIGSALSIMTLIIILYLSFKRRQVNNRTLIRYMLLSSTTYYLLSTTVHPWYLMLPLFLSIFTNHRYMLIWSFLVFLSYSAYKVTGVEENETLLSIEYILVAGTILYEMINKRKKSLDLRPKAL
ncbi:glycosyltransferase ArnT-like protein [Psychroflexus tropicus]|uniref:glycosyltransferase ArnT-like protein n=1 Tax=Psychroflexus tropicus TaxID=197345 RepID=UPI001FE0503C|nr:glycosyltransferase ArnT-like protein [Psychroflexus tropicus]